MFQKQKHYVNNCCVCVILNFVQILMVEDFLSNSRKVQTSATQSLN